MFPLPISRRLQAGEASIADRYQQSTVMFVYLPSFGNMIQEYGTEETLKWLNSVYGKLDSVVSSWSQRVGGGRGVYKVETFNNFYMAVAGCDDSYKTHADDAVLAAALMVKRVSSIMQPDGLPTIVKVGLNSGPICAGVVGISLPRFSIFGDTCNIASRMASTSMPCSGGDIFIHVSRTTADLLNTDGNGVLWSQLKVVLRPRENEVDIKGKGKMQTWFVASEGGMWACESRESSKGAGSGKALARRGMSV